MWNLGFKAPDKDELEAAQRATAVHVADLPTYFPADMQEPAAAQLAPSVASALTQLAAAAQPAPAPDFIGDVDNGQAKANLDRAARINQLATAINKIENGGDPDGGRRCNPGNLCGPGGDILHFADAATGWEELRARLSFDFIECKSKIYSPAMTFRELAWMWVAGGAPGQVTPRKGDSPETWAAVVAAGCDCAVTSTVGDFLNVA